MPLDCTTCMAMFGNGVRIIGTTIMMVHLQMEVPGSRAEMALTECCVAVLGSSIPSSVARLLGSASIPTSWAAAAVFGLSVPHPGLRSPLHSSPLALYTFFFTLLNPSERSGAIKIFLKVNPTLVPSSAAQPTLYQLDSRPYPSLQTENDSK